MWILVFNFSFGEAYACKYTPWYVNDSLNYHINILLLSEMFVHWTILLFLASTHKQLSDMIRSWCFPLSSLSSKSISDLLVVLLEIILSAQLFFENVKGLFHQILNTCFGGRWDNITGYSKINGGFKSRTVSCLFLIDFCLCIISSTYCLTSHIIIFCIGACLTPNILMINLI